MSKELKTGLYYKCSSCGKILNAHDPNVCCSSSEAQFIQWPSLSVKALMRLITRLNLSDPNEQTAALLNLYSMFEILLEESLINTIQRCSKKDSGLNPSLLKSMSRSTQIELFNELNLRPFEAILESEKMNDFMPNWKILCDLRDRMIYNQSNKMPDNLEQLITALSLNCYKAFALINNDITALVKQNKKPIRTAMVCDDEPDIRETVSDILNKEGLKVYPAASGEEAVDIYKQQRPDIVFLDVALPQLNGIDTLKHIKEFDTNACVYFVSGVTGEGFLKNAKELGAKGHLHKPFSYRDIMNVIKTEMAS